MDRKRSEKGNPQSMSGVDDLVMRAVHDLPVLRMSESQEHRIRTRATALFLTTAVRRRQLSDKAARLVRPIWPLSIAGFAVGYLLWAFHQATLWLQ